MQKRINSAFTTELSAVPAFVGVTLALLSPKTEKSFIYKRL